MAPSCRSCEQPKLQPILSLGKTPLANSLLTESELNVPEETYPLDLVFCGSCSLVQITEVVPPEKLFSEYLYFSSFSDAMVAHARNLTQRLIETRSLNSTSLVIEIASNDGYLLQHYQQSGVPVLGIEPATNIASVAIERGIDTLNEFFGEALARRLNGESRFADVIHAHNVMAHVADLNGFIHGINQVLKDEGVAVIEVPYVRDMIEGVEFDTIYHEHLCYFSLSSVASLVKRHSMHVTDVEHVPIHGGTLRIFIQKEGHGSVSSRVSDVLANEKTLEMDRLAYYSNFATRVEKLKAELVQLLESLKQAGKSIVVYGASAKGSTLLNYFGLGKDQLDYVVDRSTVKQGRYTPGTHLLIDSPERLLIDQPDYVLLLTWNFADEILAQQAEYRSRGGQFIIPIPTLRVVQ